MWAQVEVGMGKVTSGMAKHLGDVHPKGWANLKAITMATKATKNEVLPSFRKLFRKVRRRCCFGIPSIVG